MGSQPGSRKGDYIMARKTPAKNTKPKATRTAAAKEPKKAFIFFNCDEEKSEQSMNVFYNHVIYHDTAVARTALWKQIEDEIAAGKVNIAGEHVEAAKASVLTGDPTEASQYLVYGAVQAFDFV